ncbi:mRNA-decapping enzyme 1A isoform X2 [Pseudophryne corroboree]|uniref:mRNA-decapping enzyme 1A isoform X2 n=1 Tax=Pseudophryne corroboree TaxID=495146 RepID=UPI00308151E4
MLRIPGRIKAVRRLLPSSKMEPRSKVGHEMSLAALRHNDPYISGIVDVTGQVALYSFSAKANEWEKTEIEGTLFVYTRSASPQHGFTIMNRLNMHNLVEPINKDLEFQLHEPFLLYRNASLSIYSIWFYDENDCQRIAKLMTQVVHLESERMKNRKQSPVSMNGCLARPIDILEMLSKAKNEYEKSYPTVQKHLTVEELFGTSLPKEQPAPMCPNAAMNRSCLPDVGEHNVFRQPVVVKAEPRSFNCSASDFSHPTCIAPGMVSHVPASQVDSQKVVHCPVRISPSLCSSSEVLSASIPHTSSLLHIRQMSPHLSQSISDVALQNPPLLPPLAPVRSSSFSSTSHPDVDLLQKLKLTPQNNALQAQTVVKNLIAPKFSSTASQLVTPESFKESSLKTLPAGTLVMAPLQNVHEKKETETFAQPLSLSKVVAAPQFGAPTTTDAASVLWSPNVFQQAAPKHTSQDDRAGTPPGKHRMVDQTRSCSAGIALSRAQLQETLEHLIKNDSSFLNTVHDAYLQVVSKSMGSVKL